MAAAPIARGVSRAGRELPFRGPQRQPTEPRPSPIPEDWGDGDEALGDLIEAARSLIDAIAEEN